MTTTMLMESVTHEEGAAYDRLAASLQGLAPEEAIRQIKGFLATFPSFALAHNDLGVLYHRAGNPTLALAHYEKAARLQGDNTLFRKNLADFYAVELGWLEEAVDIYLEVLKRNPRDTEALIALGQLGSALTGSRALEAPLLRPQLEAAAVPATSVATAPLRSDQELYQESQELASRGDFSSARTSLELLVGRQPDNALYQNDLGVICYQLGDIAAAQYCYEAAHRLQPDNTTFVRNLADLYFAELSRFDDAIYIYLDLLKRHPRDVETLINLGHISTAVDRSVEAKAFYRRALEIEPWNREARDALSSHQQPAAAQPVERQARSADDLVAEARTMAQQGQTAQARQRLEEALAINPLHAVAHNDLGVVAYSLGDVEAAQVAYEQATKLDPQNANFKKNLADLYFVSVGRADDAIRIYLELLRAYPRDIEVLAALGHICQAVGQPDEAKTFYRRVLEIEPWNSEARNVLRTL